MPLAKIPGIQAQQIRKMNELATWGHRSESNRVEPVAQPGFDVPFKLKPGERIFTIGSCFARHVEGELIERGFEIPTRSLFKRPEFEGLDRVILNNFGIPSILNEFSWAFDELKFDKQSAFVELKKDKFVDLHIVNSVRPAPYEVVCARREAIRTANRAVADCRVLIVTLGLVELWWDEEAELYLNTTPMPSVLMKWPERFSLHVLTYDECFNYLQKTLALVFSHGRADLQVIITVSPVPMAATHRNMDVMSANMYSKSVLRAVAEQIVATHSNVTYFPSYESIMYTDRQVAWDDDLVHVSRDMVAFNVDRMVSAFTGGRNTTEISLPGLTEIQSETGDELRLAAQAKLARINNDAAFFDRHKNCDSVSFALEHARFHFDKGDFRTAIQLVETEMRNDALLLKAEAEEKLGNPNRALQIASELCQRRMKGARHWIVMFNAAAALENEELILRFEKEWIAQFSNSRYLAQFLAGRALRRIGSLNLAEERLISATDDPEKRTGPAFEYARCLLDLEKRPEAAAVLNNIDAETDGQVRQIKALLKKCE